MTGTRGSFQKAGKSQLNGTYASSAAFVHVWQKGLLLRAARIRRVHHEALLHSAMQARQCPKSGKTSGTLVDEAGLGAQPQLSTWTEACFLR